MELLETLKTRRSPALNGITAPGPSREQLEAMLTLAARVPDHGKLTPWRFIVIEGDARRRLGGVIADVWMQKNSTLDAATVAQGRAQWEGRFAAPVVVAVVSSPKVNPKIPEWEQVLSCGASCFNLLLAAKGHGFGAVWLSEWYAYEARVLAELGLAPHEKIAGFVHIGTQPQPREDRDRPRMDAIVSRYG